MKQKPSIKIPIKEIFDVIPKDTLGIDMGQTMTKLAYIEEENLNLISFSTHSEQKEINEWLEGRKKPFHHYRFTGGRAFKPYNSIISIGDKILINEFKALCNGVNILLKISTNKELKKAILVNIGTGTSIILYKKDKGLKEVQHLGGTALGGGFLAGLMNSI